MIPLSSFEPRNSFNGLKTTIAIHRVSRYFLAIFIVDEILTMAHPCAAYLFLPRDASAERGNEIACRPSVRLSVCPSVTLVDQDHIRWKSSKLIARTISATPSLLGGWGKLACWRTKAAISLKRVKIEEKLLWRAYRNSSTLFGTMHASPTPYDLLFPKTGGSQPPPKTSIAIISGTGKAVNFKFCSHIHRIDPNKSR